MTLAQTPNAYMSVYRVVDELCSGARLSAGLAGTLSSAIDCLRRTNAPRSEIGLAERISVATHRLDWAIRSGDAAEQARLRAELKGLGSAWLDTPVGLQ